MAASIETDSTWSRLRHAGADPAARVCLPAPASQSILAAAARRPCALFELTGSIENDRATIRARVPVCPGVYFWLNPDQTVIYVGKAKSLRHRLTGYLAPRTADPKMTRIRRHSRWLIWEPISHELLALIREQELITRLRPPYNVQGKPERRQPGFICLSRGVAPTVFFSAALSPRAQMAVGPIAGRGELRAAVATLNHVFQLRDCPDRTQMKFSNQLQLFETGGTAGCLRFELQSCPGPCTGGCSREAYQQRVERARKFLNGRDASILGDLQRQMAEAAASHSFERAAVVRDQLESLNWMHRRIRQLTTARRRLNGVWELPGFDQQHHWMFLDHGKLTGCTTVAAGLKSASPTQPDAESSTMAANNTLEVNWFLILAAWLRRNPASVGDLPADRRKTATVTAKRKAS